MSNIENINTKRLEQLKQYAQWERENFPGGRIHILDWAANEIERLQEQLQYTITADAVRVIAVEAIRDATGCPDIVGRDGEHLTDKMEALAREIAWLGVNGVN